jgi:hypothetical protein
MSIVILVLVLLALAIEVVAAFESDSWKEAGAIAMPGKLRVANEGLAADDEGYIYLNSKNTLFKCRLEEKKHSKDGTLSIVNENDKLIPGDLKDLGYNHVGDIDEKNGVIYIGIEYSTSSKGVLAAVNSTSLEVMHYRITEQGGMPWVAVSNEGKIYSTHWSDTTKVNVWSVKDFSFIESIEAKGVELPAEIQGGAFWEKDPGQLYLAANGPVVYKFDINTGATVQFILNDAYSHHKYEMEGITFMDLEDKGLGTMHLYGNFELLREKSIHNFSPLAAGHLERTN